MKNPYGAVKCLAVKDIYLCRILRVGRQSFLRYYKIKRFDIVVGVKVSGGVEIGGFVVKYRNHAGLENLFELRPENTLWPGVYEVNGNNVRYKELLEI